MPKLLRTVRANKGVEAKYRARMAQLVADMHASVIYWLSATYRKHPPRMAALVGMAQDAEPNAAKMQDAFDELAARWTQRFEDNAPLIADAYVQSMFSATDLAFRQALKAAGWTVEFKQTPAMRDAFTASLEENVGLIKSIPAQYLQQVQGAVMRSYSAGRDLQTMVADLEALYPKAADRAVIIARDQSNKACAVTTRARQLELGITEAKWMHSHGGKVPRPDHVAADGKVYNVAEGCLISGKYILPGTEINCRCSCRSILPV